MPEWAHEALQWFFFKEFPVTPLEIAGTVILVALILNVLARD